MRSRLSQVAAGSVVAIGLTVVLGCAQMPSGPSSSGPPSGLRATATQHWNDYARELVTRNSSPQVARIFPYLTLAQRNAGVLARQIGSNVDGAVAGASATVLAFFFPTTAQAIDAQLAAEMATLGANEQRSDFAAGVEIGKRAADDVIAAAKTDRSDLAWSGSSPSTPGVWMSLARPPAPPLYTANIGMRPFFLASSSEFRAPPPPPLQSDAFRKEVAEVRKISDNRTTEQLRIAQYWELVTSPNFPGWWNQTGLAAAEAHHLSQLETAEVLTLMHMAWLDAFSACADSKYVYWVPRPTQVDPEIRLAIGLPNHPSYPSNHSCTSAAAARVLDAKFPDQGGRYLVLAQEVAMSRIYGGIHYPIDTEAGLEIGRKVAAKVLAQGMPPDRVWLPARP
jgi:PAP2 superfamily protein